MGIHPQIYHHNKVMHHNKIPTVWSFIIRVFSAIVKNPLNIIPALMNVMTLVAWEVVTALTQCVGVGVAN